MQFTPAKGAIILAIIAVVVVVALKLAMPHIESHEQKTSSDAANISHTIRSGVDNYAAYSVLCSRENEKRLRKQGIRLDCDVDKANYEQRIEKLRKHELQFAVATVDSDILNSVALKYPGVIGMVLSVSKGSDGLVCRNNVIAKLDDLKTVQGYTIAYTEKSPTEFFIKNIATHFGVDALLTAGSWSVPSDGSEDALQKLLAKEVDCAGLWEPDYSSALEEPGIGTILDTSKTQGMIVDVLLVEEDFANDNPDLVKQVFLTYFKTLKALRDDPDLFNAELKRFTGISDKAKLAKIKDGIQWVSLEENATEWMPVGGSTFTQERIIDTITNVRDVFLQTGDFSDDPLPDEDPYMIVNSTFIEALHNRGSSGGFTSVLANQSGATSSLEREFSPLTDNQWAGLKDEGTLKGRNIAFQSGSNSLEFVGKQMLDEAANTLKMFPDSRLLILGHTGTRGKREKNLQLSQRRADAVAQYLKVTYGLSTNRIRAIGKGSSDPLPRKADESGKRYNARLKRVEIKLLSETL